MSDQKSFLELKIIWKDEHMFELNVIACNKHFKGIIQVYDTTDSLLGFAKSLNGYPKAMETLSYEAGQKNSYAYFSMEFYCIDNAGHLGVLINLEKKVPTYYRPKEKDKLTLEILTEPNAIDNFQKQLINLVVKQEGTAILLGRDN